MNENKNELVISKEQEMLMPIAENYLSIFPEIAEDKTFNAKQAMISMALKLKETKDKNGRPAIESCSKESIIQVAQEVLVKKLDIMKSQASLIVYGNKLTLQAQYQGNVKRALELNPFLDHFNFMPVYDGDDIQLVVRDDGKLDVAKHITKFSNISNQKLLGGYVRAIAKDGSVYTTEVMTMEQIRLAWSMSKAGGDVHKKFPVKMVRKTILNSLCSWLINTTGEVEEQELDQNTEPIQDMSVEINSNQEYSEPIEVSPEGVIDIPEEEISSVEPNPVEEELPFEAAEEEPVIEKVSAPEQTSVEDIFNSFDAEEAQVAQEDKLVCSNCGATVSERVAQFSKDKFGRVLCFTCQKAHHNA